MATKLVNQDKGKAFDIVFANRSFWPVLAEVYRAPAQRKPNASFTKVISNEATGNGTKIEVAAESGQPAGYCVLTGESVATSYWAVISQDKTKLIA